MRIYFVRHGQTIFNQRRLLQGWCDSPLSEDGINQAKGVIPYFRDIDIKAIYSSISLRALDTAEIIGDSKNLKVEASRLLREMHFGNKEGLPLPENHLELYYLGYKDAGGEINEETGQRIMDFVLNIYEKHLNDEIIIVSHAWAIRSFLRLIDKKRLDDYFDNNGKCPNCSLSIVDYDGDRFIIEEVFKDILNT